MKSVISKDQFVDTVSKKLKESSKTLQYGPMLHEDGTPMAAPLRDERGLVHTFSNLIGLAENLYDSRIGQGMETIDPLAEHIANFSGVGYADVAKVSTLGALDVTILTYADSLVPFVSIDRVMDDPVDVVYYNNLVAIAAAGGVSEGDKVLDNFSPDNSNVNLGSVKTDSATAAGATHDIDFSTYLLAKSVVVTITDDSDSNKVYEGRDFNGDGAVFFSGACPFSATIDYSTGVVAVAGLTVGDGISVTATVDTVRDPDASNVLRVKSDYVPTMLETFSRNIILEQNMQSTMHMNKIMARSSRVQGDAGSHAVLAASRVAQVQIEDVNKFLLRKIVSATAGTPDVTISLAGYGVDTFAETKNDIVGQFFIDMKTDFLSKIGVSPTACVAGSKAVARLMNVPVRFVPAPLIDSQQNGFIGTFDGMPIYRHNYLDSVEEANKLTFRMVTRLPDNSSASMIYGEYLPITQTPTVGNYTNPMQSATGWFSQTGEKVVDNKLITKGQISLT